MGELDVRLLLRLLRDEPEPDPMLESLLEMYREWCRQAPDRSLETFEVVQDDVEDCRAGGEKPAHPR